MTASAEESNVFRAGGISYLEIPSDGTERAAAFYAAVFGWNAEGDRFADSTGHVIGHFVSERQAAGESGVRPYVFVLDVQATIDRAQRHGGQIVRPPYPEGNLTVATVRDPFGNVIGVWQRQSV